MVSSRQAPAALTSGKEPQYTFNSGLDGPQRQSGHFGDSKKTLLKQGFNPRTVQTVANQLWYSICLFLAQHPLVGHGLLIHKVSRSHTTHHSRKDSSVRMISLSQRPLPHNTQHSKETEIHRTPLDEGSARRQDLYLTTHDTHKIQTSLGLLWTRDQPVAETST